MNQNNQYQCNVNHKPIIIHSSIKVMVVIHNNIHNSTAIIHNINNSIIHNNKDITVISMAINKVTNKIINIINKVKISNKIISKVKIINYNNHNNNQISSHK